MNTPYYLTATSRAVLAARAAEIREHLRHRREAPRVRAYQAVAAQIVRTFETPFVIGGERLDLSSTLRDVMTRTPGTRNGRVWDSARYQK